MAFLDKDWFVRQLKMCVDMAASLVLGKEFTPYVVKDLENLTAADQLHLQIVSMLDEGNVNDAEDALFDGLDPEDADIYYVGIDFYNRLNQLDDNELAELDFSRDEIRDGLIDMSEEYGCGGLFEELKLSWSEE